MVATAVIVAKSDDSQKRGNYYYIPKNIERRFQKIQVKKFKSGLKFSGTQRPTNGVEILSIFLRNEHVHYYSFGQN